MYCALFHAIVERAFFNSEFGIIVSACADGLFFVVDCGRIISANSNIM